MLRKLTYADIKMSPSDVTRHLPGIFRDMVSEGAADHLCDLLVSLARTVGVEFSAEFEAVERAWRIDERDHYEEFRYLVSLLSDETEDEIDALFNERKPDFSDMMWAFGYELAILVTIIWDEMLTTILYGKDRPIYEAMGHPDFLTWINHVKADEKNHFVNFLEVLLTHYADRAREIFLIVDRLVAIELERSGERIAGIYTDRNSFVMDRGDSDLSPEEIRTRGRQLKALIQGRIHRSLR